jgi:hypothetical protein
MSPEREPTKGSARAAHEATHEAGREEVQEADVSSLGAAPSPKDTWTRATGLQLASIFAVALLGRLLGPLHWGTLIGTVFVADWLLPKPEARSTQGQMESGAIGVGIGLSLAMLMRLAEHGGKIPNLPHLTLASLAVSILSNTLLAVGRERLEHAQLAQWQRDAKAPAWLWYALAAALSLASSVAKTPKIETLIEAASLGLLTFAFWRRGQSATAIALRASFLILAEATASGVHAILARIVILAAVITTIAVLKGSNLARAANRPLP